MLGRRLLAAALLLTGGLVALPATTVPASAAGDPPQWYDGNMQYSKIVDCGAMMWADDYSEKNGVSTWVGAVADLDESPPQPGIGQNFYIHVIVGGIGNACSGTGFRPGFTLPPGVTLDTSQTIYCYVNGQRDTNAADCPQGTSGISNGYFGARSFAYISGRTNDGNLWPAAPGQTWEFQFAVRSTTAQNMATLQGHVKVLDGNDSPLLDPAVKFNVFAGGSAPSNPNQGQYRLVYDKPSTFAAASYNPGNAPAFVPHYGLVSEGKIFTQSQPGRIFLQRAGTVDKLSTAPSQITFDVDGSQPGWKLYVDWHDLDGFSPLVAGKTYYWRTGFRPTGGSTTTWGQVQSFSPLTQLTCDGKRVTVATALGQSPTDGDDVVLGTPGADTINGLGGNDTVCALGGNDVVDGGSGHDYVDAGEGNDTIVPREGDDLTVGGPGTDTISYYGNPTGVRFALGFGFDLDAQNTGGAGRDAEDGVENLIGTESGDVLRGSNGNNLLIGKGGSDTLYGNGGDDVLMPGTGDDTVDGMGPLPGATPGSDTVSYADLLSNQPATVDLLLTTQQDTGSGGLDTLLRFVKLVGGKGSDVLKGTNAADTIKGGKGKDEIDGRGGNDKLLGEDGDDGLIGGTGSSDRCDGGAGRDTASQCEVRIGIP